MRQAAKIKSFGEGALVLFSGDAYNPSMLSTITQARAVGPLGPRQGGLACGTAGAGAAWPLCPVLLNALC